MMATATTWQVGVVGAGNMGSGIAQKIAQEGFRVILCDNAEAPLARGMERVRSLLDEGVARGAISPEQRTATTARLTPTVDLAALKDCQLVIEAVFEDLAIKKDLLRSLEQIVAPTAILATNTSSFQVDELANALAHPERFIGLHFFYHPVKNRLVEVVAGPRSELALVKAAWDFMVAIGKTPIATKDTPGFCVNRFFVPWLNEAVRLLDEKVAPLGAIETVAKEAFAIGMGPFELMNVTGVPIAYHAAASLATGLSEFYQPAARLTAQFQSGQTWEITDAAGDQPRALIAERLLAVVWTIACQIVETGIASLEDVDRGAKIGLRWRFGPFELMNRMGIGKALAMVEQLVKQYPALPV
ncbi:MAG: 3-hydroxyacyl-CoA dehydrogenase/enoyl-CoA hydratase family protein, partial [Cyanobacteria bacterium NC_groundwater_1444_Ag_S-0.65um_54_12]|nr:3-hydroxyacyl-CoA dehydrogenase/enoyl-CoA hydratase family protein [Cyanobacteria bacterium NC_groundwater_1444_Ag_S-0.65um_54_12]